MPLIKGKSDKSRSKNIAELIKLKDKKGSEYEQWIKYYLLKKL